MKSNKMILAILCLVPLYYHCSSNAGDNENPEHRNSWFRSLLGTDQIAHNITTGSKEISDQIERGVLVIERRTDYPSMVAAGSAFGLNMQCAKKIAAAGNPRAALGWGTMIIGSTAAATFFNDSRYEKLSRIQQKNDQQ